MRIVILLLLQISLLAPVCEAEPLVFLPSIQRAEKLYYKHFPNKGGETTGRTESWVEYAKDEAGNPKTDEVVWTQNHHDRTDYIFSTTEIWFDPREGVPIRSHQIDRRGDIEVTGTYSFRSLQSTIRLKEESFQVKYQQSPYRISLELLSLYLQNKLERVKKKDFTVEVTIPSLVLELRRKSLPYSMGQLNMKAQYKGVKSITLENGTKLQGIEIFVEPTSWFLRAILPADKKTFKFVYEQKSPHRLLSFDDGVNTTRLVSIEKLQVTPATAPAVSPVSPAATIVDPK